MDASAISLIQKTAIEAARENILDTFVPAALVDNDKSVISLENFQGHRAYFRGEFSTCLLSEFASYVKANPGGKGFINHKCATATVFHNLGDETTPGLADWRSHLMLEPTAAYASALGINAKNLTQKQLVEWLEDWADHIGTIPTPDADHESMTTGLHAIRTLNIKASVDTTHTDKNFGASKSSFEDIEASSKAGLPWGFTFATEPYLGFRSREFVLRLSVITGDTPYLKLRIVGFEKQQEDIAKEFRQSLLTEIGEAATMAIGAFSP